MKRSIFSLLLIFYSLVGFSQVHPGGIVTATGFQVQDPQPADNRMVHDGETDRNDMLHTFFGLISVDIADPANPKIWINGSAGWVEVSGGGGGTLEETLIAGSTAEIFEENKEVDIFLKDTISSLTGSRFQQSSGGQIELNVGTVEYVPEFDNGEEIEPAFWSYQGVAGIDLSNNRISIGGFSSELLMEDGQGVINYYDDDAPAFIAWTAGGVEMAGYLNENSYGGNISAGTTGFNLRTTGIFDVSGGSSLGTITVKNAEVTSGYTDITYLFPAIENVEPQEPVERYIPVSVNGNFADANGNITVSGGGGDTPDLDAVLEEGATASITGDVSITSNSTTITTPAGAQLVVEEANSVTSLPTVSVAAAVTSIAGGGNTIDLTSTGIALGGDLTVTGSTVDINAGIFNYGGDEVATVADIVTPTADEVFEEGSNVTVSTDIVLASENHATLSGSSAIVKNDTGTASLTVTTSVVSIGATDISNTASGHFEVNANDVQIYSDGAMAGLMLGGSGDSQARIYSEEEIYISQVDSGGTPQGEIEITNIGHINVDAPEFTYNTEDIIVNETGVGTSVKKVRALTQTQYDGITPDANTVYFISGAKNPFVVTNTSYTTTRTAANLNTDYPTAPEGYTVLAPNVSGGAEMYVRTSVAGNWIKSTGTLMTP